jgi:hypothetical protein
MLLPHPQQLFISPSKKQMVSRKPPFSRICIPSHINVVKRSWLSLSRRKISGTSAPQAELSSRLIRRTRFSVARAYPPMCYSGRFCCDPNLARLIQASVWDNSSFYERFLDVDFFTEVSRSDVGPDNLERSFIARNGACRQTSWDTGSETGFPCVGGSSSVVSFANGGQTHPADFDGLESNTLRMCPGRPKGIISPVAGCEAVANYPRLTQRNTALPDAKRIWLGYMSGLGCADQLPITDHPTGEMQFIVSRLPGWLGLETIRGEKHVSPTINSHMNICQKAHSACSLEKRAEDGVVSTYCDSATYSLPNHGWGRRAIRCRQTTCSICFNYCYITYIYIE